MSDNPASNTQHAHNHAHDHRHHHAVSEANRSVFDGAAATYEEMPEALAMTKMVGRAVLESHWQHLRDEDGTQELALDESDPSGASDTLQTLSGTVLLDFACGPGMVSRELAPFVAKVVGIDLSQGMVDAYNKKARNLGFDEVDMHAVCLDILGEEGAAEAPVSAVLEKLGVAEPFDLAICTSAFHHIPTPGKICAALARLLKPGGALIVVDIFQQEEGYDFVRHAQQGAVDLPEAMRNLNFEPTVAHRGGFGEAEMRAFFVTEGGLGEFEFRKIGRIWSGEDKKGAPAGEGEDKGEGKEGADKLQNKEGAKAEEGGHGHGGHLRGVELFLAKGVKAA